MKTTIDISDALLAEAKRVAARDGVTLRALVEQGLRRVLDEQGRAAKPFELRDASVAGDGLQPGIDPSMFRELAYEGRGG